MSARHIGCWIITQSHAGMRNQCLGLAHCLDLDPIVWTITPSPLWKAVPVAWRRPFALSRAYGAGHIRPGPRPAAAPDADAAADDVPNDVKARPKNRKTDTKAGQPDLGNAPDLVSAPDLVIAPELVIACGRAAIAPALAAKRRYRCAVIYIHDPRVLYRHFDLVIAADHDRRCRPGRGNIVRSDGALHNINPAALKKAANTPIGRQLARKKPPITAVLLGGKSKHGAFDPTHIDRLAKHIIAIRAHVGGDVIIQSSRRTQPRDHHRLTALLAKAAIACPIAAAPPETGFFDHDRVKHRRRAHGGENPYMAVLATAARFIVTADSVSMLSEVCSLGKPVYIADAPTSPKLRRFHHMLIAKNAALPLDRWRDGNGKDWQPIDSMSRACAAGRALLARLPPRPASQP